MVKKLFIESWKILCAPASPWWLLLALPMVVLAIFDTQLLQAWHFADGSPMHRVAQFISHRGDFYNGSIILVLGFVAASYIWRRPQWRILALVMVLSCATAGILSLGIRVTSGRPRPSTQVADGLYGPQWKPHKTGVYFLSYDYQSYPSGHATTAMATAVPALIMAPVVGVPLTAAALSVGWSRLQLKRHQPSDIYMGWLFGAFFGTVLTLAARRLSLPPAKA